jgi:hypothetical protein
LNWYGDAGFRDEFMGSREPTAEVDCEECPIPMDRPSTHRVSEIPGTDRPKQSWDEVQESGEACPAQSERRWEIGNLGMAGLHIMQVPARLLARERRVIQLGGSSTPLEEDPTGLLSSTFSGSSGRVNYRRQLKMNTQDSDEDRRYPEKEPYLLSTPIIF